MSASKEWSSWGELAERRAAARPMTAITAGDGSDGRALCTVDEALGLAAALRGAFDPLEISALREPTGAAEQFLTRERGWFLRDWDSVFTDLVREGAFLQSIGVAPDRPVTALAAWRESGLLSSRVVTVLRDSVEGGDLRLLARALGPPAEPVPREVADTAAPEVARQEFDRAAEAYDARTDALWTLGDDVDTPRLLLDAIVRVAAEVGFRSPQLQLRGTTFGLDAMFVPGTSGRGALLLGEAVVGVDEKLTDPVDRAGCLLLVAHEGFPGHAFEHAAFESAPSPLVARLLRRRDRREGWASLVEHFVATVAGEAARERAVESVMRRSLAVILSDTPESADDLLRDRFDRDFAHTLLERARRTRIPQDDYVVGFAWWRHRVGFDYQNDFDWMRTVALARDWAAFLGEPQPAGHAA